MKQDLLKEVDACGARLPDLMASTHAHINEALIKGDLDTARRLQWVNEKYNLDLIVIRRRQIKVIDSSQEMAQAIAGFKAANKDIEAAIKETQDLAKFLQLAAAIAGLVGKMAGLALV